MTAPRGRVLDDEQFHRLAMYGEVEHVLTAEVDILRDTTATEPERLIYRGGPGDFLGELDLLTGQDVYLTARVVTAGTVVRIGRRCCAVSSLSRTTAPAPPAWRTPQRCDSPANGTAPGNGTAPRWCASTDIVGSPAV